MAPTLVEKPPAGEEWITEVKWDGYRTMIVKEGQRVAAYTRNGHDWSSRYWPITLAAELLPCRSALLDGEMVVLDVQGRSSFSELQAALGRRQSSRLAFVAFDLLHLDGMDLSRLPLVVRRERLQRLVAEAGPQIQFSEALPGTPAQIFAAVDQAGLEGVVCKLADSRYQSGRAKHWLKVKTFEEGDFDLIGVRHEPGKPAIALMAKNGRYAGGAFITLPSGIRERLWRRIEEKVGPAPKRLKPANAAQWVKPGIVARVRYLRGEDPLRHATLKDWREDQP